MAHDPFLPEDPTTHDRLVELVYEVKAMNTKIDGYRLTDEEAHDDINKELSELKIIATSNQMLLEKYKGAAGMAALAIGSVGAAALFIWEWVRGEG